jgi:hypothetical protein
LIVYNLYFVLIALSAIGGPSPNQGPRDMSLDLVWGVVSMFIVVTVIGEAMNWLGENIIEITGTEKEISRFNKRLNSAVHDFVEQPEWKCWSTNSTTKQRTSSLQKVKML